MPTWRRRSSSSRRPPISSTAGWPADGQTSALGTLLDPIADKVLVLATSSCSSPRAWRPHGLSQLIIAREFLVSGLRLAAIEPGIVMPRPRLGKLKTWSQSVAVRPRWPRGGRCMERRTLLWWFLLVASDPDLGLGLDYARVAPRVLRGRARRLRRPASSAAAVASSRPASRQALRWPSGACPLERGQDRLALQLVRLRRDLGIHGAEPTAMARSGCGAAGKSLDG